MGAVSSSPDNETASDHLQRAKVVQVLVKSVTASTKDEAASMRFPQCEASTSTPSKLKTAPSSSHCDASESTSSVRETAPNSSLKSRVLKDYLQGLNVFQVFLQRMKLLQVCLQRARVLHFQL